jgi:hypothetical protein
MGSARCPSHLLFFYKPLVKPLSTTDVAAIQTDRDGRSGFRRVFDFELASGIESELLGSGLIPRSTARRW